MKNLYPLGLVVVSFFAVQSLSAQQPVIKPIADKPVFSKFPAKLECAATTLKKLPLAKMREAVSLQFGDLQLAGEVVDKIQRAPQVLNMNIRLTNYSGALFTLSVVTDENNHQKLVGRIVDPAADEVLVLTEENNRYFFVKEPKEFFMTE
jgi:hypothetical protein